MGEGVNADGRAFRKGREGSAKIAKNIKLVPMRFLAFFANPWRASRLTALDFLVNRPLAIQFGIIEPAAAQACHFASLKHSIPAES